MSTTTLEQPETSPTVDTDCSGVAAGHLEEFCDDCGGKNVVWYAPNSLWNEVVRRVETGPDPMLCPRCFALRVQASGRDVIWKFEPG